MSAQSTDVRVNQITPKLFARAKTPYEMVKLSVEEIREIIRPVGLSPMKSKGIYGFEEFSNKKSILKQNLPSATDLMMPPYNNLKQKFQ